MWIQRTIRNDFHKPRAALGSAGIKLIDPGTEVELIKSARLSGLQAGDGCGGGHHLVNRARSCRVADLGTLQINPRYSVREARYRMARQSCLLWVVCGGSRGLECDSGGGKNNRSRGPGRVAETRERFARRSSNGFHAQNSARSVTLSGCHVQAGQNGIQLSFNVTRMTFGNQRRWLL